MTIENVIIIGSGPAGYTAGIYASRALLKPLMLEGDLDDSRRDLIPGGQLMLTTDVENYPGFPEGVDGKDMMAKFKAQAERFGTRVESAWIDKVDFTKRPFTVTSGDKTWQSKAIIIATGASAKWLGIESETLLRQTGYVSACATCDGALPPFRNKHLGVVGGGDTAMEEALFLTRYASKVTVIHRRDELRASKVMQEKAKTNDKIEFAWNKTVSEVLDVEKKKVTGVKLKDTKSGEESTLDMDGLFLAIGHTPATGFLRGVLDMDDVGYIETHKGTYTSVEGVFAAGDCVDHVYRQAVTAAGQGCMAAIDAERWLEMQSE